MGKTTAIDVKIGNTLKKLRNQNKLTQKEVARFLNINPMSYSRYEQDLRQPDFDTLAKLAVLFKIDFGSFFVDFIDSFSHEFEDKYEYRLNKDFMDSYEEFEDLNMAITQRFRVEKRTIKLISRVNTIIHGGETIDGELKYLEKQLKTQFKNYKEVEEFIELFGGYNKVDDEIIKILGKIQEYSK